MQEQDYGLARLAIDYAISQGAQYVDARLMHERSESIEVKNGKVNKVSSRVNSGIGIRVFFNGCVGFAANPDLREEKIKIAVDRAIEIARASELVPNEEQIQLTKDEVHKDKWTSEFEIDPFEVPLQDKLELLFACHREMSLVEGLAFTQGFMNFWGKEQLFVSSEGAEIEQNIIQSGAGITATAVSETEVQTRSFPSSFRGFYQNKGYELIHEMKLIENAKKIAEETKALLTAEQCPSGTMTVILGESQLALQVHESCGHPVELDRALGQEANFAGTSFLTDDLLNDFVYGSEIVNIVQDGTTRFGLGAFGYDDEGVKSTRTPIIEKGIFKGYLMSRDTAPLIGLEKSNAACRATDWNNIPMVRMTCVNLLPGDSSLKEMIESTEKGILLTTNRSWSIDDKRLNFQFGTEIGWMIENGKITHMVKNPTYSGKTPVFWKGCTAIAGESEWKVWGTPNCGKGQPCQVAKVGHGVSYAKFENVKVGDGYDR